jgi:hypothetical protein
MDRRLWRHRRKCPHDGDSRPRATLRRIAGGEQTCAVDERAEVAAGEARLNDGQACGRADIRSRSLRGDGLIDRCGADPVTGVCIQAGQRIAGVVAHGELRIVCPELREDHPASGRILRQLKGSRQMEKAVLLDHTAAKGERSELPDRRRGVFVLERVEARGVCRTQLREVGWRFGLWRDVMLALCRVLAKIEPHSEAGQGKNDERSDGGEPAPAGLHAAA